jgi:hypothetical protein
MEKKEAFKAFFAPLGIEPKQSRKEFLRAK